MHPPATQAWPPDEARLERFVARVEALGAAEWGALDARCAALARVPEGVVRRAWLTSLIVRGTPIPPAVAFTFTLALASGMELLALTGMWWMPARRLPDPSHLTPEQQAFLARGQARLARLVRAGREAPGGSVPLATRTGLLYADLALAVAGLPPDAARQLYAYVEPVIPRASLERPSGPIPAPTVAAP